MRGGGLTAADLRLDRLGCALNLGLVIFRVLASSDASLATEGGAAGSSVAVGCTSKYQWLDTIAWRRQPNQRCTPPVLVPVPTPSIPLTSTQHCSGQSCPFPSPPPPSLTREMPVFLRARLGGLGSSAALSSCVCWST